MSTSRDHPRHMTRLPGGGSAQARYLTNNTNAAQRLRALAPQRRLQDPELGESWVNRANVLDLFMLLM